MSVRQISPRSFGAGWVGLPFGNRNHFSIIHEPETVAMTGAAVATVLFVPYYPHRITQIIAQHRDAAHAKNTTALTAGVFQRREWSVGDVGASDWHDLYDFSGEVASDFVQWGGDAWEYEGKAEYRFSVNTTENHLMLYKVRLQMLDKKGKELGGGKWTK